MTEPQHEQEVAYGPSFGIAFFVVLASGAVAAMIASPLARFLPIHAGRTDQYLLTWSLLTSIFAASTTRVLLRLLSYKITYAGALTAYVAGSIATLVLLGFFRVHVALRMVPIMPSGGLASALALVAEVGGLLVTTWVIQYGATGWPLRRRSALRTRS